MSCGTCETHPEGELIGKVTHYFDRVGVAVVDLTKPLKVGDTIRIEGGEGTSFTQPIDSMEVEHQKIEQAKAGDSVGLKVNEKVKDGYRVYKL
ncbi:MAG: hypothetical protein HY577_02510 [Candidatus Nealsonbacteria bacterium]|nr:hypothetical protein [Candidatus Nealsonbacteria bacterium]